MAGVVIKIINLLCPIKTTSKAQLEQNIFSSFFFKLKAYRFFMHEIWTVTFPRNTHPPKSEHCLDLENVMEKWTLPNLDNVW